MNATMENFDFGTIIDEGNFPKMEWIEDLIYYDGPILSSFKDENGDMYLFLWVDCDVEYNRWLIVHTRKSDVEKAKDGKLSSRKLIGVPYKKECYLMDIDNDVNYKNIRKGNIEDIPDDYLPDES